VALAAIFGHERVVCTLVALPKLWFRLHCTKYITGSCKMVP
jgi:hypothetical protein